MTATGAALRRQIYAATRAAFHYALPRYAYRRLTSQAWREEEIEMDLLPVLIDTAREAVDVGANVGHYAVRLSALVPLVHAFEAHPRLAYVLRRSLPENVKVYSRAVSDRKGHAVLVVPFHNRPVEGMASLTSDRTAVNAARAEMQVRVETSMLDELADRDIGFVKIDVEGHEGQVLAGATRLIERQRPTFIIEVEERHRADSVAEVFRYFSEQGYSGVFIKGSSIFSTSQFTADLQSADLNRPGLARKDLEYVNNFIFMPQESWSRARHQELQASLRAARAMRPSSQ